MSEDTWVALFHRPADPSVAGGVFADPRFGDHLAFLERMAEAGYLVAAGPLSDRPGEGMTILRLPGEDRLDRGDPPRHRGRRERLVRLLHRRGAALACGDVRLVRGLT